MRELFLGSDVSKGYMDAIILDSSGVIVSPSKRYFDSPSGHQKLSVEIKKHLNESTVMYAGVESTGGYENNWVSLFAQLGAKYPLHYSRINPRSISNSGKVLLTRTVTDEVSAQLIADYLRRYKDAVDFKQSDKFASIRRLWSARELMHKSHTAIWLHLQMILYDANPVILPYTRNGLPQWVLLVLQKYPTAHKLAGARSASLAKIPYVSLARAGELIEAAKVSVAKDREPCTEFLIQQSVANLIEMQARLSAIESKLIEEMGSHPEMELLTSIDGIGQITAVGLLMNIGDINRFENVKKLASYFGLHPMFKESGDGKSVSRMSKVGKKRPRMMLYMAVMGGLSTNTILKTMHAEAKQAGMSPMASIGKCMHKLLRIVYGVLKSGKKFDVEIHNGHKLRGGENATKKQVVKTNVEGIDRFAPVSAREAKRLKSREIESQNGMNHLVRDHQLST